MGLFDAFRKKRENHASISEYVPINKVYPMRNGEEMIGNFSPSWADAFPDFPYTFVGRPAMRTSLVERMRDVFSIAPSDAQKIADIFDDANRLLEEAHGLAEFPVFHLSMPDISNGSDLSMMPVCWIRCIPFTEKSHRISKFPFRFEYETGRMRKSGSPDAGLRMEASLGADGTVGRIEAQLSIFEEGASFGHFWTVTAKIVDGALTVSRIAESRPDGGMPTLYSIGR